MFACHCSVQFWTKGEVYIYVLIHALPKKRNNFFFMAVVRNFESYSLFLKVKNKKRWSQVMYMSYVLDFKTRCMEGMCVEYSSSGRHNYTV